MNFLGSLNNSEMVAYVFININMSSNLIATAREREGKIFHRGLIWCARCYHYPAHATTGPGLAVVDGADPVGIREAGGENVEDGGEGNQRQQTPMESLLENEVSSQ